jgi:hypothetical protein
MIDVTANGYAISHIAKDKISLFSGRLTRFDPDIRNNSASGIDPIIILCLLGSDGFLDALVGDKP